MKKKKKFEETKWEKKNNYRGYKLFQKLYIVELKKKLNLSLFNDI